MTLVDEKKIPKQKSIKLQIDNHVNLTVIYYV